LLYKKIKITLFLSIFLFGIGASSVSAEEYKGYRGLIAPKGESSSSDSDERKGYRGLLSGKTYSKEEKKEEIITEPSFKKKKRKEREKFRSKNKELNVILDEEEERKRKASVNIRKLASSIVLAAKTREKMLKDARLPNATIRRLAKIAKKKHRSGLSVEEFNAKTQIEAMFTALDEVDTKKERKEVASDFKLVLETLKFSYKSRRNISPEMVEAMGIPDIFIKQQNSNISKAIRRIDAALDKIRKYL